jgi:hypothetical protein
VSQQLLRGTYRVIGKTQCLSDFVQCFCHDIRSGMTVTTGDGSGDGLLTWCFVVTRSAECEKLAPSRGEGLPRREFPI